MFQCAVLPQKMAAVVQGKLRKIKLSAKNVADKYKEVFDQTLQEIKKPADLRAGLEAFVSAGKQLHTPWL